MKVDICEKCSTERHETEDDNKVRLLNGEIPCKECVKWVEEFYVKDNV